MKKTSKLIAILSLSLFLISCSASTKNVDKMYFFVKDNSSIEEDYYAYSYLTILPDHEVETLELTFKMIYASSERDNFEASGEVAAPYYMEFLELSDLVMNGDIEDTTILDEHAVLEITVDDKYGKRYEQNVLWDDETLDNESFKSFYLELVDILTVEAPV